MDDLVVEFLTETNESLDELDNDLVTLEQNPNDQALLGKIFRLVHTIKGTCGFLDLPKLEKVAHHAENVLGRFRSGDLEVTPEYVTLIFESIDVIKYIVGEIEANGAEPDTDNSDLIARLDDVYENGGSGAAPADPVEKEPEPEPEAKEELIAQDDEVPVGMATEEELQAAFDAAPGPEDMAAPEAEKASDPPPAVKEEAAASAAGGDKPDTSLATQTLRVNVDVLENLMTMVSELVLTRNQLLQILRTHADNNEFSAPLQRLNHVVSDLQEGVMKTRMQPIGNAWSKLPRIIRDLAIELNKKIDLEMRGQDTELDRQVLDLIKDPLTHMVRNSGDHGIEDPATRKAAGKPETGRILLNAYHEGGHIIIEISDDGKGLSTDKIRAKVLENGLASAEELETMSTQQIQQFIFKAGFSTAEKVTAVSGRGVGMDVVRTNIEKIGGSIELKSTEGKGSTFTIKIPLTLAIVSALIVEASKERFAIPQLSVQELVMASSNGANRIEEIKGTPVFRLRDRLLPLVSLTDLMKLQGDELLSAIEDSVEKLSEEPLDKHENQEGIDNIIDLKEHKDRSSQKDKKKFEEFKNKYIVVTQVGNYSFGIIVDRVYDTEEIVVKPVSKILRDIDLFSGNTILGDGSVIMIIDPNGIARATGEIDAGDAMDDAAYDVSKRPDSDKKVSLLLFSAGDKTPKAVPLSLVARLENIKTANIEYSSGQMLVQYRGSLMPLIPYNNGVSVEGVEDKPVLVFSDKDSSLGIIVDDIIDITADFIDIKTSDGRPGLLGSAIINEKATDVVDVAHFLSSVNKNWFKDHGNDPYQKGANGAEKSHVLLVDDSPFFRNMISPILKAAGYDVTATESAGEALAMCEKGQRFDLIVSDIEMPDMDGFEFAQKIKSEGNWQNTPMVALSSHATPQDIDRGLSVGFEKYVAKFDRDTLLQTISQTLSENENRSQEAAE